MDITTNTDDDDDDEKGGGGCDNTGLNRKIQDTKKNKGYSE